MAGIRPANQRFFIFDIQISARTLDKVPKKISKKPYGEPKLAKKAPILSPGTKAGL